MDKKQIKSEIDNLKREMKRFLKVAETMEFPDEMVEQQMNLYLEDLKELLALLKKSN